MAEVTERTKANEGPGPRLGRRPGPTHTKQDILDAARAQFSHRGYAHTTMRSVAEAAGVHPALIHYHFGTKQDLYREALQLPVDPWEVLNRLVRTTPRHELPEALARQFVSTWRDPETRPRLLASARRAFVEPEGAAAFRAHVDTVVIPHLAAALQLPAINIAGAISHLIGVVLTDSLIGIQHFTTATDDELITLVAPAIAHYLNIGQSDRP